MSVRLSHWALTLALCTIAGCPKGDSVPDAGLEVLDSGAADTGLPDATVDAGDRDAGAPDAALDCPSSCEGSCYGERCVPTRRRRCDDDRACPESMRCSSAGACFEGQCLSHADCPSGERCAARRCLERVDPAEGVAFERVYAPPLTDHRSPINETDHMTTYGYGAALFDLDGDLDLDAFIGTQAADGNGSAGCIYRNESVPGELRFEPIERFCQAQSDPAIAGYGLDLEGDGYHELLLAKRFAIELHRFHPQHEVLDLMSLLPAEHPGRACQVFGALALDLNLDGRADLLLGCGSRDLNRERNEPHHMHPNLVFLQTEAGALRPLDPDSWYRDDILLNAVSLTHALGAADVDEDGLMDVMISEEAYYSVIDGRYNGDPGGVYRRCAPSERCGFQSITLGEGVNAFGAYMGSGLLQVEDRGELLYYSNLGPNRLIEIDSGAGFDTGADAHVQLATFGDEMVFSWGVVVDDFNRDGRDDLFVSNGSLFFRDPAQMNVYYDTLLLQGAGAAFTTHSEEVGIAPFTTVDSGSELRPYSSRASAKVDWDGDGFLDLLTVGLEGVPRIHREVPTQRAEPPRCTLVPINRYVPSYGFGFAIVPDDDPRPRRWDSQGQHRLGTSPFVVSPWTQGSLVFPSGASVRFDCGAQPGPVIVEEPEWLNINLTLSGRTLTLGEASPGGSPAIYAEPSGELLSLEAAGPSGYRLTLPARTERFMLRIGDRWVARWFTP